MALADQAKEHVKSFGMKIAGGVIGLISAGALMWFTPLVDRFIKPPKPIANFEAVEASDGLTVTFKNLSQNAKETKWDFGDSTPLEILPGTQTEVPHKYKKANSYTVTLVVTNVADQEDRRVNSIAVGVKPQLLDVHVKAIQQKEPYVAPAKFKFIATADMDESKFEWDFGKGSYEPGTDTVEHTFNKPGKHTIRVRAVVGNAKSVPQIKEVELLPPSGIMTTGAVSPAENSTPASPRTTVPPTLGTENPERAKTSPPAGQPLQADSQARKPDVRSSSTLILDVVVRTTSAPENLGDTKSRTVTVKEKATGAEIVKTFPATPGYLIKKVNLEKATIIISPNLINLHAETVDNGSAVKVKAQVTKPGTDVSLQALLTYEEVRNPALPMESSCTLSIPGSGILDRPIGRKHEFEVHVKGVTVLKLPELPMVPVNVSLEGRNFLISTVAGTGDRLNVVVREIPRKLPS